MADPSLVPPLDAFNKVIRQALAEDEARADPTSNLLPPSLIRKAVIKARQDLVVCGAAAVAYAFEPTVRVSEQAPEGSALPAGGILARLEGPACELLRGERSILNLLGRLAGIATWTRKHVEALPRGSRTRILDTRKTTPGLRTLEKYAVRCGGGTNHRTTLAEAIFVKDNHIAAAGGLDALLGGVTRPPGLPLIIEVETIEGVLDALRFSPDRILLDNMDDRTLAEAVRIVAGRCELEASGGITLERLPTVGGLGLDFISIGALTHAAPWADISLEIVP